jgi:hypothetical protein
MSNTTSTMLPADLKQWPHGTQVGYYGRGCRCEGCRSWQRFDQQDRRRRQGVRPKAVQLAEQRTAAEASRRQMLADLTDSRHGRAAGYRKGCRCDACKAWNRRRHAEWKQRQGVCPPDAHGTRNGYGNYGCRCDACTAANTAATRKRRETASA